MGLALTNNRVRSALERGAVPIDTSTNSGAINAGDIVYETGAGAASLSAASGLTAAIVAALAKFLGISNDTYPIPFSDSLTETVANPTITRLSEGEFAFKTTTGDALVPGTAVTIGFSSGADAQTVEIAPVGPDCTPTGLFVAGTVTGGTLTAGTHVVEATYITSLGETLPGKSVSISGVTAGQGLIYDYDNAGAFSIPAWALGIAIYIDGVFAYSIMSNSTALAADLDITGIDLSNPRPAPTQNALALGKVAQDQTSVGGSVGGTITGAAGQKVVVRIAAPSL